MASCTGPNIVNDSGLMMMFDAGNASSYVGSGTTWDDIVKKYDRPSLNWALTLTSTTYDSTNRSLVFDGTNAFATSGSVNLGSTGTINLWFRQSANTNNKGLFSIGNGSAVGSYFYIGGSGGVTRLSLFDGVSYSPEVLIQRQTDWNMATWTWNSNNVEVYLNGGSKVSGTMSNLQMSNNLYIGIYPNLSPSSRFNGSISHVSVYNRVLTSTEVSANYESMKLRHGII